MSVAGKFTTIQDVIERVRRSGINDFTEEEAKEWTWEVVQLIGNPKHLCDKVAVLAIENARSMLPYDISDITEGGVRDYYTKISLKKESNIYYNAETVGDYGGKQMFETIAPSVVYVDGIQQTDTDTYLAHLPGRVDYPLANATYKVNNGFLFTGFKTGLVEMAYKAFPVDNENNPMIEDNITIIRAVVAYISKLVVKRMWLRDEISKDKMYELSKEYSFAVGAAVSDSALGSIEDMETIRARTNRLYRDPNLASAGFAGYERGEHLNLD